VPRPERDAGQVLFCRPVAGLWEQAWFSVLFLFLGADHPYIPTVHPPFSQLEASVSNPQQNTAPRRRLRNPVIAALLAGILLALVALVVLIAIEIFKGDRNQGAKTSIIGEKITRDQISKPPEIPKPIGDPDRIKDVLQQGKTYRLVLKAGIEAVVEDKAYTLKTKTNMAYMGEFVIKRHIESNDGHRIVEIRTFESCKTLKLESHVDELKLDWGLPGELTLASLEVFQPGLGLGALAAKAVVETVLKNSADLTARDKIQQWHQLDSLSGKTVRIVFEDGQGMVELEPVGSSLTASEKDFVYHTSVLTDYYLFPDVKVKPSKTWKVDASKISAFIDPSLRSIPSGSITVKRGEDQTKDGKQLAKLTIESGYVELDGSDASTGRVGSFSPQGDLMFNITDGFIQDAELRGSMKIEKVSKDHLLFETTMRSEPKLKVQYHCEIE
jgi:hypothetical protein